jgi:hypothetical protein
MRARQAVLAVAAACIGLTPACSSGPQAEVHFKAPDDGAMVSATPDVEGSEPNLEFEVEFDVKNFTLQAPGACDGMDACGHVHIQIDGDRCNDSEAEGRLDYNEEVFQSPAAADLIYCQGIMVGSGGILGVDGDHVVTLTLVDDDESPVLDDAGKPIADARHVDVHVVQPAPGPP